MPTNTPSLNPSGARRILLAVALSVPLSALLLGGSAFASGPNGGGAPGEPGNSAAAPGQQDKENGGGTANGNGKGQDAATSQPAAPAPAPAPAPAQPKKQEQPAQPAKKADAAPAPAATTGSSNGTSGTPSSPQPLSNADKNGTGANPGTTCTHAYCSTRNGSPSLNGNGGGEAGGKPCAGCVGRADNKNPRGQAPNGSDRNKGYECDENKGIGRGNPAHTGCTPGTEVLPTKPGKPTKPGTPTTPATPEKPGKPTTPSNPTTPSTPSNPACPAGSMAADCAPVTPPASCIAGDAAGPQAPGCPSPGTTDTTGDVLANALIPAALRSPSIVPLDVVAPQALVLSPRSAVAAAVTPSALPFTGADLAVLLPLSLIALALGIVLVAFGRTRRADQA